jgi:hypothetical protein
MHGDSMKSKRARVAGCALPRQGASRSSVAGRLARYWVVAQGAFW